MRLPRAVRAVIFDMDGLLIDSEVVVRAAVTRAAIAVGHEFPETLYGRTMGCSDAVYVAALSEHFGPGFPLDRFREHEAAEIDAAMAAGVCLKAGVIELVDQLDQLGMPYAIATSSTRETAHRHMTEHALLERFRTIVAREDVPRHKPFPDPFLEAAARIGVDPTACLALEDSHNGVRAAHAAGMMTVMVPDLLEATAEMRGLCVHVAETLHEIAGMLTGERATS